MSRKWFENLVKRKVCSSVAQNLQSVGLSHSKSVKIVRQKFEKQSYFSDRRLAKYDIQLLFKLRTRITAKVILKESLIFQYLNERQT